MFGKCISNLYKIKLARLFVPNFVLPVCRLRYVPLYIWVYSVLSFCLLLFCSYRYPGSASATADEISLSARKCGCGSDRSVLFLKNLILLRYVYCSSIQLQIGGAVNIQLTEKLALFSQIFVKYSEQFRELIAR